LVCSNECVRRVLSSFGAHPQKRLNPASEKLLEASRVATLADRVKAREAATAAAVTGNTGEDGSAAAEAGAAEPTEAEKKAQREREEANEDDVVNADLGALEEREVDAGREEAAPGEKGDEEKGDGVKAMEADEKGE
jgi:hypothetical protein